MKIIYPFLILVLVSIAFVLVSTIVLKLTAVDSHSPATPVDRLSEEDNKDEIVILAGPPLPKNPNRRSNVAGNSVINPSDYLKSKNGKSDDIKGQTIGHFEIFYKGILKVDPTSPGMNGKGVKNLPSEREREEQGLQQYSFNELASSKISLERTVPDNRQPICKEIVYGDKYVAASVIIAFHNEAWSTLLRTVHTVLARSPPQFLHEIILVDDASLKGPEDAYAHLGERLELYVKKNFTKVKLLRTRRRIGAIQARMLGADKSEGDILVFLDSHCEVTNGWIEPLLAKILENPLLCVVPHIETISGEDFSYEQNKTLPLRGVFDWNLEFKWSSKKLPDTGNYTANPVNYKTPIMSGVAFAIARHYFYMLGAFDRSMTFSGVENIELSLKAWMCGDNGIEIISCSRVGHVSRVRELPYYSPEDSLARNKIRIAEVFMDEYKQLFYVANPGLKPEMGGDISYRTSLHNRLLCKSFDWFLNNIMPELEKPDKQPFGYGRVENVGSKTCMDIKEATINGTISLSQCLGEESNTFFLFSSTYQIQHFQGGSCLELSSSTDNPRFNTCDKNTLGQKWEHENIVDGGFIRSPVHDRCLEVFGSHITAQKCNLQNRNQLWLFQMYVDQNLPFGEIQQSPEQFNNSNPNLTTTT